MKYYYIKYIPLYLTQRKERPAEFDLKTKTSRGISFSVEKKKCFYVIYFDISKTNAS